MNLFIGVHRSQACICHTIILDPPGCAVHLMTTASKSLQALPNWNRSGSRGDTFFLILMRLKVTGTPTLQATRLGHTLTSTFLGHS
jgi:hypothetical protein